MEYIGTIRDFLVVITTSVTILGIFFKAVNKFFLDTVRNTFEVIPGKKSLYNTIINTIVYIILSIEIIVAIGIVIGIIISLIFGGVENSTEGSKGIYIIINTFLTILDLVLIYLIFCSGRTMGYLFIEVYKILGIKEKDYDNFWGKYLRGSSKDIDKIKKRNATAIIIVAICIILIIIFNSSNLLEERIILGILAIFSISISITLSSLSPIIEVVNKEYKYYITLKTNEVYIVDFFLDFENSYLIVEHDVQRYISKQEVREIKKVLNKSKSKA